MTHFAIGAEATPSAYRSLPFATALVGLAAVGAGSAIGLAPPAASLGVCGLVFAIVLLLSMAVLPLWQKLATMVLAGFMILNYGFANFPLLPGIPIPAGDILLLASLLLAIRGRGHMIRAFLNEPVVIWWTFLVGLSAVHLVLDIPRYGIFAVRDASFVLEGLFLLLGYVWARPVSRTQSMLKALAVIFVVNWIYALAFPVSPTLQAPPSVPGLFRQVPLLGSPSSFFLVSGAFFYLLVGGHIVSWPRVLVAMAAMSQIGVDLVYQDRSMYVGIVVAITLLMLLRGARFAVKVAVVTLGSMALFFLVVSMSGSTLRGRVGEVGASFLSQHVGSLFFDPNAPAEGTIEWRLNLWRQLWSRFTASADVAMIGEGFGEPLIDAKNTAGVAIRQPHNTHITVLLRLGTLGFAGWFAMHWRMLITFVQSVRHSKPMSLRRDLILWLLLFYVLAMLLTSAQPWLEFSYGAVPFYVLMGLALGICRESRSLRSEATEPPVP